MTNDEVDVMKLGKAVERLYENEDFKTVILGDYIDRQALVLGKSFDGSESQLDAFKAITHLSRYLIQSVEDGKIVVNNNKGL